jgi:hypothetical protein
MVTFTKLSSPTTETAVLENGYFTGSLDWLNNSSSFTSERRHIIILGTSSHEGLHIVFTFWELSGPSTFDIMLISGGDTSGTLDFDC